MARTEVVYDDVDFAKGKKTDATVTIEFSYRDSGKLRLDLNDAHAAQLDKVLAEWLAIATEVPAEVPAPRTRTNSAGAGNGSNSSPVWSNGVKLTRDEMKLFRTWAFLTDGENEVKKYPNGGYSYSVDQIARFEAIRNARTPSDDTPPADTPPADDK